MTFEHLMRQTEGCAAIGDLGAGGQIADRDGTIIGWDGQPPNFIQMRHDLVLRVLSRAASQMKGAIISTQRMYHIKPENETRLWHSRNIAGADHSGRTNVVLRARLILGENCRSSRK